jgi:hypothetical protein
MSVFDALNALIEANYGDAASASPSAKLFADYTTTAMPASGARKPHKGFLRSYFRLLERLLDGTERIVTDGADVAIDAATDDRVIVAKAVPAATNVNFPTAAARIAATGGLPIRLKNGHANPAMAPLQPVLAGGNTIDGSAAPLPQDSSAEISYWPKGTGDWQIR